MPLIMGADGAKLSKRHGAVSVEEYKKEGFLPEALVNYLSLLGWSPGDDREVIPSKEAVKIFELEKMRDVQSKFDVEKLKWMNGEYIMKKTKQELLPLVKRQMEYSSLDASGRTDAYIEKLIELYQIRVKTLREFAELTDCFFKDDFAVDEKGKQKYLDKEENRFNLTAFAGELEGLSDFSRKKIEEACRRVAEERALKASGIIHPARMAISGKTKGAGLFEMMEVLGKEKTLERLRKAAGI
jgi:glutamyl-tRNA synthetase